MAGGTYLPPKNLRYWYPKIFAALRAANIQRFSIYLIVNFRSQCHIVWFDCQLNAVSCLSMELDAVSSWAQATDILSTIHKSVRWSSHALPIQPSCPWKMFSFRKTHCTKLSIDSRLKGAEDSIGCDRARQVLFRETKSFARASIGKWIQTAGTRFLTNQPTLPTFHSLMMMSWMIGRVEMSWRMI